MSKTTPLTITAATLGLSIAIGPMLAGYFVSNGLKESRKSERFVTAKGLVERIEKADRGIAQLSYKVAGNDLGVLYKDIQATTATVKAFLLKNGFVAQELTVTVPTVTDMEAREWGQEKEAKNRYILDAGIAVHTNNVDQLAELSNKLGDLIEKGIALSRFNISYQLEKFNDLRPEMIAAATENARHVAQSFAKNSGSKIGVIRRANQGAFRIMNPDSPNAEYDTGESSLMKMLRVVSTIEFYLED